MSKKSIVLGLSLAISFQILVLVGEYVSAALPLWRGQEVRMKTLPVDPRSMFRGNYARLNYGITRISESEFPDADELRNGEVVYIVLQASDAGLYEFQKVLLTPPADGVFIRGRIANRSYEDEAAYFRLKYGIEAYFAPKEKALALEKQLRDGGVAVLMIDVNGKAALKAIEPLVAQ